MKCIAERINEYEMNDQLKNQIAFAQGNYYYFSVSIDIIPTLNNLIWRIFIYYNNNIKKNVYNAKAYIPIPLRAIFNVNLNYYGTDITP